MKVVILQGAIVLVAGERQISKNGIKRRRYLRDRSSKRFSGIAKAKFCSNACRQKAKYARKKALPTA